jgi:thioester reductase-like protein
MTSALTALDRLSAEAKRALLTRLLQKKAGKALLSADHLAVNVSTLEGETTLDASIDPEGVPFEPVAEPRHVLLTGATGFLGAFLLRELLDRTGADIHCLVRAANVEEGLDRLRRTLQSYSLWHPDLSRRIIPLAGDLGLPGLGLSQKLAADLAGKIDVIYHSGAFVNWIYPYERLKAPNVLGTEEILRLATRVRVKAVHFVSSLGVFPLLGSSGIWVVREDDTLDHNGSLYGGYLQSKWVADKLVLAARARGVPVCIYRPGLITGHSETGAWNTGDVTSRMLKSWVELEGAPIFAADETDMTPVDYISRAIVHLSARKDSAGKIFHLANSRRVQLGKIAEWMRTFGYRLRSVPYDSWVSELLTRRGATREDVLSSLVPLFSLSITGGGSSVMKSLPAFDCQNAVAGLADSSIRCAPIDGRVLGNYFSHFISSGFVAPPPLAVGTQ